MNYSEYLFSRLLIEIIPEPYATMEYDLLFALIPLMYKKFEDSECNHPKLPEYDCMVEYLLEIKNNTGAVDVVLLNKVW